MKDNFYDRLLQIVGEEHIRIEEPMKKHTTFRVGGAAAYFVVPKDKDEVRRLIVLCREEKKPYYIIGNGSNLLVSDKGYEGVIIQIYKEMGYIEGEGNRLKVQAGAALSQAANAALAKGLTGLEFASGIPGTVGGACVMNAGAYGGEMKDILQEVTVLTSKGEICTLQKEELKLGYRTSIFLEQGYTVLEAVLLLKEENQDKIRERMEELKASRIRKQPLEYPSAGSTFKRPEGNFAGKLIQEAGLCGFALGGAKVSEKHCGFVVNYKDATASDIDALMKCVIEKVRDHSGITLEPEVKRLGEF